MAENKKDTGAKFAPKIEKEVKKTPKAKPEKVEEKVVLVVPKQEEDVLEEKSPEEEKPSVTFVAPKTDKPDRDVRIKMGVTHSCIIGGERYYLEKDKYYNVPSNVKRILDSGNLLKPL